MNVKFYEKYRKYCMYTVHKINNHIRKTKVQIHEILNNICI